MRKRLSYRRLDVSYTPSLSNVLIVVGLVVAASSLIIGISGYNSGSSSDTPESFCDANNTLSSDCLPESGAVAGTYIMPVFTVDQKGRITNIADQQFTEGNIESFNQTLSLIVYINGLNGSDVNDGFSISSAKQTLNGALNAFTGRIAHNCEIVVINFVELGENPVLTFYPATFGCDVITMRGVRANVKTDTVSSISSVNPGTTDPAIIPYNPIQFGRNWANVSLSTGGYDVGEYDCNFVHNINTMQVMAIESNTESHVTVVTDVGQFGVGNVLELYSVLSEIRWSGEFYVDASQKIDFTDIVFNPHTSNSLHETRTPEISTYRGCLFNLTGESSAIVGSKAQLSGIVVKAGTDDHVSWCANTFSAIIMAPTQFPEHCKMTLAGLKVDPGDQSIITSINNNQMVINNAQFLSRLYITNHSQLTVTFLEVITTHQIAFKMTLGSSVSARFMFVPTGGLFNVVSSHLNLWSDAGSSSCTITTDSLQFDSGARLTLGTIIESLRTFLSGPTVFNSGSQLRADVFFWIYNMSEPLVSLSTGSSFYLTGTANNWITATLSQQTPLFRVNNGSSTAGAVNVVNRNFPTSNIQCGINGITGGSTITNDLSTNTFCG